jgi:hypothetical protein
MPTKTSSEREPPRPFDRASARGYALTNLLALPGLGTWLSGRRIVGAIQMALALTGFALTTAWAFGFATSWIRNGEPPMEFDRLLLTGVTGVFLFATAWLWSLASSLAMLQRARDHSQPPAGPTPRT